MSKLEQAIAADPGARAADEYQRTRQPVDGADYKLVEAYAKEAFLATRQMSKNLDDKATAIINFLASGTGLFTLGTLAGVATAKVPPVVVLCALPSMLCAVAAIILATLVRKPREVFAPGSATQAAAVAEAHANEELDKKFAFAMFAQWNLLTALMRRPLGIKVRYLDWANWAFVAAIALLLLPLIVSLMAGPAPHSPAP